MAREQPAAERGGATTTPPKFKKTESLKGRAQAQGTATPLGHPPHSRRGPANPGSSKLLKRPQTERRGSGAQKPAPAARAEPRPASGPPGGSLQPVVCSARPCPAAILHLKSGPAAKRGRGGLQPRKSKWLQKPLKGLLRREGLGVEPAKRRGGSSHSRALSCPRRRR